MYKSFHESAIAHALLHKDTSRAAALRSGLRKRIDLIWAAFDRNGTYGHNVEQVCTATPSVSARLRAQFVCGVLTSDTLTRLVHSTMSPR